MIATAHEGVCRKRRKNLVQMNSRLDLTLMFFLRIVGTPDKLNPIGVCINIIVGGQNLAFFDLGNPVDEPSRALC